MNRNIFDLVICSALAAVAMSLALLAPENSLAITARPPWASILFGVSRMSRNTP